MFVSTPPPGGWFLDGGLAHNNPSQLALDEAQRIWPTVKQFCLVSVGTGWQRPVEFLDKGHAVAPGAKRSPTYASMVFDSIPGYKRAKKLTRAVEGAWELKRIASAIAQLSTSSERVHEHLFALSHCRDPSQRFPYYRFNVQRGIHDIELEEWKATVRIGELTARFMDEVESQMLKRECVDILLQPPQIQRMPLRFSSPTNRY